MKKHSGASPDPWRAADHEMSFYNEHVTSLLQGRSSFSEHGVRLFLEIDWATR